MKTLLALLLLSTPAYSLTQSEALEPRLSKMNRQLKAFEKRLNRLERRR